MIHDSQAFALRTFSTLERDLALHPSRPQPPKVLMSNKTQTAQGTVGRQRDNKHLLTNGTSPPGETALRWHELMSGEQMSYATHERNSDVVVGASPTNQYPSKGTEVEAQNYSPTGSAAPTHGCSHRQAVPQNPHCRGPVLFATANEKEVPLACSSVCYRIP